MKKYIVSVLVASVFLIGAPFAINSASAQNISIRDFINLLVAIGVITPDKMPAVNSYLTTLDNQLPQEPDQFSITVLSPNGGETYKKGDTVNINWSVNNFNTNTLAIDLLRSDGSLVYNLGVQVNPLLGSGNNTPFTWVIPQDGAPGGRTIDFGEYKIRICRNSNSQVYFDCDISNNSFSIISQSSTSETASGIIKSVYIKSGKNYLDIDYITINSDWKPGGQSGPAYTNINTQIRTFEISPNVNIMIYGSAVTDKNSDEYTLTMPTTFSNFKNLFTSTGTVNGINIYPYQKDNPWDIVITNNIVTQITERYIP